MAFGITAPTGVPASGCRLAAAAMVLAFILALPAHQAAAQDSRLQGEPPRPLGTMTVPQGESAPAATVPGTTVPAPAGTVDPGVAGTTGPSPADHLQLPGKVEQMQTVTQVSETSCVADLICLSTEARDGYATIVAELTAPLVATAFVDIDAGNVPDAPERVQALLEGEGRHVVTRLGPIPEEYSLSTTIRARLGAVHGRPDSTVYWLPFASGEAREVIWLGTPDNAAQRGYVQWAADPGTPVRAARSGTVGAVRLQTMQSGLSDYPPALGNLIAVVHDDGTVAVYGRLDFRGVGVMVGQRVQAGEVIGTTGLTGVGPDPALSFTLLTPVGPNQGIQVWPVQFQTAGGVVSAAPGAKMSAWQ